MVIHQADRLHEGIANRGADKLETAFKQVAAQRIGYSRARRNFLQRFPMIANGVSTDELPKVAVETPKLILNRKKGICVFDSRFDLEFIAHDAFVREEFLGFAAIITGDLERVEIIKSTAVVLAFF